MELYLKRIWFYPPKTLIQAEKPAICPEVWNCPSTHCMYKPIVIFTPNKNWLNLSDMKWYGVNQLKDGGMVGQQSHETHRGSLLAISHLADQMQSLRHSTDLAQCRYTVNLCTPQNGRV